MIIFGSPSRYIQGPGALGLLGREIARLAPSAVLVIDPVVQDRHGDAIASACAEAGVALTQIRFGGECTDHEVEEMAVRIGATGVVVAAGGGKCLDTGKALANRLGASVVCVPTVASTDAPTSHNYVVYDEHHRLLEVRKLPRNPVLVVVDTSVIAQAPRPLLAAGIGDAIGKIYEVEACANAGGLNIFSGKSSWSAVVLARGCHDILLENAEAALAAVDEQLVTVALERVVEATVLMSGLAFESGGLSVSHSMTRGLSRVAKYAAALHGFQVAYANLVQLRLEGRPTQDIRSLAGFYERCGIPRSLRELGGAADDGDLMHIAAGTMTSPHIGHFPRTLSAGEIFDAMEWVEAQAGVVAIPPSLAAKAV